MVDHDLPINHISISDDSGEFRVSIAPLGSLIDICTSNDRKPIIDNAYLGMNVYLERSSISTDSLNIE